MLTIYFILYVLDFYQKILTTLGLISIFGAAAIVVALIGNYCIYNEEDRKRYENPKNLEEGDYVSDTNVLIYKINKFILKFKKLWLLAIILTLVLPSKKTVEITSAIFIGQTIYEKVKDEPITQKTYLLLEKKLDELLKNLEKDNNGNDDYEKELKELKKLRELKMLKKNN